MSDASADESKSPIQRKGPEDCRPLIRKILNTYARQEPSKPLAKGPKTTLRLGPRTTDIRSSRDRSTGSIDKTVHEFDNTSFNHQIEKRRKASQERRISPLPRVNHDTARP
jgi:hypothetical protein